MEFFDKSNNIYEKRNRYTFLPPFLASKATWLQENKKRKTRKVFISHSHTKNISKNIIGSIYFSYLYLDRKHIFVVFMTMFRFIVPKLI